MRENLQLFASCPRGIEDLLQQELRQLGAEDIEPVIAGVGFRGNLKTAYRISAGDLGAARRRSVFPA
jgi:23S rRNA (guanine2445-N2)-methyltransferase / 23S rRNA (guanine2069-N7)-methyltransferase